MPQEFIARADDVAHEPQEFRLNIHDMMEFIYTEYFQVFDTDVDVCFRVMYRDDEGGVEDLQNYTGEQDAEMDLICFKMLEMCMECERAFAGTFWLEFMRCLTFGVGIQHQKPRSSVLNAFMHFMMKFNDNYPKTLPTSFHSVIDLNVAAMFYLKRYDFDLETLRRIDTLCFVIEVDSEDDGETSPLSSEEWVPEHEADCPRVLRERLLDLHLG